MPSVRVSLARAGLASAASVTKAAVADRRERRVVIPSPMKQRHGLQCRETVERFKTLFPSVARALDAAEGQLDAAAGAVIVDEDLAGGNGAREAQLAAAVASPDAADEAIRGAVGDRDRLLLAGEGR